MLTSNIILHYFIFASQNSIHQEKSVYLSSCLATKKNNTYTRDHTKPDKTV